MILLEPEMKPEVLEFVVMPVVAQEGRMHLYQVIKRAGIRFHIEDEKDKKEKDSEEEVPFHNTMISMLLLLSITLSSDFTMDQVRLDQTRLDI